MYKNFYSVNGNIFYNKNLAIIEANGDLSKIKLHFDENKWDSVDWQKEPVESWQQLCTERALELRQKYDYLALWYSGGYDSHTILLTFIKNNILLDELTILERNNAYIDTGNLFAQQTAKLVKEKYYPNLKINIIDYNINDTLNLYKKWGSDWIYKSVGSTTRFSKTSRCYLFDYNHVLKNINKKHTRGDILGHEKCKVYLYDNQWFTFFTDSNLGDFNLDTTEDFFYSPSLYKKQVFNTINWFETLPDFNSELVHDVQGRDRRLDGNFVKYYAQWNLSMGRYPLDPLDNDSVNGMQKFLFTEDVNSLDSKKILTHLNNSDKQIYNIYINGYKKLETVLAQYNLSINPTILSKPYYIRHANLGIIPKS